MQDQACTKLGASNIGMYPPVRTNTTSPENVSVHLKTPMDTHVTKLCWAPPNVKYQLVWCAATYVIMYAPLASVFVGSAYLISRDSSDEKS